MQATAEDRVRMERAHVHAWPALHTVKIDGWLWRASGGGSQRANSVSTIEFTGQDPSAALTEIERRYRAVDLPARLQTFDETMPPQLADLLRRRGYRESSPTTTMFKPIGRPQPVADVEVRDYPWDAWSEIYLGAITEDRRIVNTQILERVPRPRAFLGGRRNGRLTSTALCVIAFGCAVIECVTTAADARRQGSSRAVLTALEQWAAGQDADLMGLQVQSDNAPALLLYNSLGFVSGATNYFWVAGNRPYVEPAGSRRASQLEPDKHQLDL